ncbi:MAG: DUF2341 domain-containing protein [Pseudomonadota bacterium]
MKLKILMSIVTLLAFAAPAFAADWWNEDWAYRKEISVDPSAAGAGISEPVTDVPVLLRLSVGTFPYFADAKPDGSDIRFLAADDITPLPFYIESWDGVNQIALVWVRLPRLIPGTTPEKIFMYYGNPDAIAASDAAAVYDVDTKLVYTFSDGEAAVLDRTGFGNNATNVGAAITPTSLIGGGVQIAAAEEAITLPASPTLAVPVETGFTATVWARFDATPTGQSTVLSLYGADPLVPVIALGFLDGTPSATVSVDGSAVQLLGLGGVAVNQWVQLGLTLTADATILYVNGDEAARGAGLARDLGGEWRLAGVNSNFTGEIDQLTMTAAAVSDSRLKVSARNQMQGSTVTIYGGDQTADDSGGGHEGYFITTLRNVTIDGWVVIFILMIMFLISCWVMWIKGTLLTRIERQNAHFLKDFNRLTGDPLALDQEAPEIDSMEEESFLASALEDEDSYHPSTLFPLYHVGAVEVKKRLARSSPAAGAQAAGFSGRTIGVIGASIDTALVRQRQKLNRLMVLLTIAISGGPFLGLLGTVVGVMITFAAIAASGDVNVNSIAPGIAAALVATVAGLGVAIPALFGYNYLGSRIKDIDANTQVFADQFINRIAEHYG